MRFSIGQKVGLTVPVAGTQVIMITTDEIAELDTSGATLAQSGLRVPLPALHRLVDDPDNAEVGDIVTDPADGTLIAVDSESDLLNLRNRKQELLDAERLAQERLAQERRDADQEAKRQRREQQEAREEANRKRKAGHRAGSVSKQLAALGFREVTHPDGVRGLEYVGLK